VNATFIGIHAHDDRLPDFSERGIAETLADAEDLLERLDALPPEPLSVWQRVDRQLAEGFLRVQRWESTSLHFGPTNPIHFTGEAIFGLVSLLLHPSDVRLHSAARRLEQVPAFLQTGMDQIRSAPEAWIERALHECVGARLLLEDAAATFPVLHDAAAPAASSFADFERFLQHQVTATEEYASGGEAFELLLRHAHVATTDAAGVERLALERIAVEDDALRTPPPEPDPAASHPDYLAHFTDLWHRVRDVAIDDDVVTFPDWPVRFVDRPAWAQRAAPYLYFLPYRSPAPYDAPLVVDYLTPRGADDSTIKLNHVVHHASLGHHVQNWFAARSESRIGRIAAVDCASRIAMLCGGTLAEGWANYATDLADDSDPGLFTAAERYGQHRARLRMAARAVVDIRLHQGRFTLQDAIDFYSNRVGMPAPAARAEAVKNSLFPGAACMYLLGWDAIWRLRRELESRAAAPLSLRAFHDRFLSFGSIPVSLIARAMLESTAIPALSKG
jgi:uncharacterized protein (DUF885 family)